MSDIEYSVIEYSVITSDVIKSFDCINQISRLYALWFHTGRFFDVFPYISQCKICNPGAGPFLAPGA